MNSSRRIRNALGVGLALWAVNVTAAQHSILVGGGYELAASQAQIELNLGWVKGILESRGEEPRVYFTDGDDPAPDVFWHDTLSEDALALEPLARVFGMHYLQGEQYRNHGLQNVIDTTQRDVLEPALAAHLSALGEGDEVFLVYNGHGAPSTGREDEVALKLWGDTRMSAAALQDLLDTSLDPLVPLRYVFTQCYSGGFHRLIYADSAVGQDLSKPLRCGFTAESPWRQSEGCSASIELGDYRDYTTFFFAALKGEDRLGRPLLSNPDQDQDGQTTMFEAHLYTLEHAHSTDLSRASSEVYLEQQVPFYMNWIAFPDTLPDNPYGALAARLAARLDVPIDAIVGTARARLATLRRQHLEQREEQRANREEGERLRVALQAELLKHYPQLALPYTGAYLALLTGQAASVQSWIQSQPTFPALVQKQDADAAFTLSLLALERDIAQIEKLIRLRRLAFYLAWLIENGDETLQADYARLLECESAPLTKTP